MTRKIVERKQQEPEKKGSHWNPSQSQILLNYIITYKNKIFQKISCETIQEIYEELGETRSMQQCSDKIDYLRKAYKTYDKMVAHLQKKSKVSTEYIKNLENLVDCRRVTEFQPLLEKIRSKLSMKEQALIMLITSFNPQEVEFQKPIRKMIWPRQLSYLSFLAQQKKNLQNRWLKILDQKNFSMSTNQLDRTTDSICYNQPSSESHSENNIENQQEENNQENNNPEIPVTTKSGWNSTELLRYIVFLEKYAGQFPMSKEYDNTTRIYNKMARFLQNKSSQCCRMFHQEQLNKNPDFANIISKIKQNLFTTEEQVLYETKRISEFYQKDLKDQLNAFKTKKSFLIESSSQQISEIAKHVQQWIIKYQLESQGENQKELIEDQQENEVIKNIKEEQQQLQHYRIEIPIQLHVFFKKEQQTDNKPIQHQQKCKNTSIISHKFPTKSKKILKSQINNNPKNQKKEQMFEDQQSNGKPPAYRQEDWQKNAIDVDIDQGTESESNDEQKNESKQEDANQLTQSMNKKKQVWTISQNMKFFVYLATNYQTFIGENPYYKRNIINKMKEFIGTKKSYAHCLDHLHFFKRTYSFNLGKVIEEEAKKFNITQKFIDEFKDFIFQQTQIVNIDIAKDTFLTLSILPTKVQIDQKEKIQIFMEKILENGMEISAQISKLLTQKTEKQLMREKENKDSLSENISQQFLFKSPKAVKRKITLGLPGEIMKKLQKKEDSVASLIAQFKHIIEIDFKSTKGWHKKHNNEDRKLIF